MKEVQGYGDKKIPDKMPALVFTTESNNYQNYYLKKNQNAPFFSPITGRCSEGLGVL